MRIKNREWSSSEMERFLMAQQCSRLPGMTKPSRLWKNRWDHIFRLGPPKNGVVYTDEEYIEILVNAGIIDDIDPFSKPN